MSDKRIRAPKLPRFGLNNVPTDRQGVDWMDGVSTLDFDYFAPFQYVIDESQLALANLPPFHRQLSDAQANALSTWASKGNMARESLGLYWSADFNTDGKLKRSRMSWKVGDNLRPIQPLYLTHQSCGRPMKSMPFTSQQESEDGAKRKSETPADRPPKVVLLHDNKDSEKVVEMEYEIDRLKAALKRSQARWEGLQMQMDQVETAMTVRSELVTSAIVNYHFSRANLQLLSPAISSLVDETVASDDISQLAGGAATLDHRVKIIQEISNRLQIPITIDINNNQNETAFPICPIATRK